LAAQILPPAKQAEHVKIIQGPTLELAVDNMAILRWTSTNPGGDDDHFAIAHYGMNPGNLNKMAKSHIRLNRNHPRYDFPSTSDRFKAADHLLLLGDFNGQRRKD
jgi:hypothetical protein